MEMPRRNALSLLAVTACAFQACRSYTTSDATAQRVGVEVHPPAVDAVAGDKVSFAAAVTGTADLAVVWQVVEVQGGTVDVAGLYTAPVKGT